jgi:hypothetical protein
MSRISHQERERILRLGRTLTVQKPEAQGSLAAPSGSANLPPGAISLEQIVNQPCLGRCSMCGRKTWEKNHIAMPFWRCNAEKPDGSRCQGVWIPADAYSPNDPSSATAAEKGHD